ncbi:MAG: Gfo/Idh/MocA family oxidoreductase [Verrucomicrobiae bacterium]|nr:Gfo/Idh/MocA family oxidoreductase [Verrucomicrobiae bacterium]NNJ43920.1 Gfo/Idh/MocA family oxidoreductase [Akkermansiaceae bacterium]
MKPESPMSSRRDFIKSAGAVGAGLTILPSGMLSAANSANNKLNIAVIGVGGRGAANLNGVRDENIVALCDVDARHLAKAAGEFPKAKTYVDWRKCLEQKNIDAVVCSTTDHTHAFVNVWAMNRGMHVYCEKPLANSVHEARVVRETYLRNKGKIATQMGTQIHASDNYRRVVELIRDGVIGDVKSADAWVDRPRKAEAYYPAVTPIPAHIDWDLWLGPSPHHDYNPGYPGSCLKWNRFWDFGTGQIGDMGCHLMDLPYWALNLRFPTRCEAQGKPLHPDSYPEQIKVTWEHPATDQRPGVKVRWFDGGPKPGMPLKAFNRDALGKGILFTGEKGWLLADYGFRVVVLRSDMTGYDVPTADDLIPRSLGHHQEWIQACKTGSPTTCDFDYSGALVEHNLLGAVAFRSGQSLDWDASKLEASNCPEAQQYVKKTYRDGWVLNG